MRPLFRAVWKELPNGARKGKVYPETSQLDQLEPMTKEEAIDLLKDLLSAIAEVSKGEDDMVTTLMSVVEDFSKDEGVLFSPPWVVK